MLCQNCQKRVAKVHFTRILNNKKVEMYLCEQCAQEKGHFSFGAPLSINDFFTGLMGYGGSEPYITSVPQQVVCDKCGMSYEEFQKTGKLGCSNCYELYGENLNPLLKRLHGNVKHHGKLPVKVSQIIKASKEIDELKKLLSSAIANEDYEKAAELRDRIRGLESNSSK